MDTLIHADIFFFISTIGFIVFFAIGVVILVYVVGILRQVKKISQKIGDTAEEISDEAKEFVHDIRESGVYRLLFGHKKKHK